MTFDKKNVKTILFFIFSAVILFWGLQRIGKLWSGLVAVTEIIKPFLLGGAIAFIVNVPMRNIENFLFRKNKKLKKLKRPVAYLLTIVCLLVVLALALFVIIPEIAKTINMLAQQVPVAYGAVKKYIDNLMVSAPEIAKTLKALNINLDEFSKHLISIMQNSASSLLNMSVSFVGGFIGGTVSFVIGFVFSIYLLFQKEKLARQAKQVFYAILPSGVADRLIYVLKMSGETFSKFISGQCLEAVILGVMFFVVMTIFRFQYALLISVLIALTALIPIIGAFIGCIIGAFLLLIVNPLQALLFVIVFLVLQQVEGNLIYPYVVGGSIGLPSIWVLVAVTVGGGFFGVVGVLIFIPLSSVFYSLFREFVMEQLEEKKIPSSKWK